MINDSHDSVSNDAPVTLTPLDGVDLIAVAPRSGDGLPVAVRLIDATLAGGVASLVDEGSVSATDEAPCPATPPWRHPAEAGSSLRAGRALDRLVARARARTQSGHDDAR